MVKKNGKSSNDPKQDEEIAPVAKAIREFMKPDTCKCSPRCNPLVYCPTR